MSQNSLYPLATETADEITIRRIADYEKISGILWILLGIIQTLSIVGAIAGIWNIVAGGTRVGVSRRISQRLASVPKDFEGVGGLAVIGVINLLVGGVIGLIFVGFDFYIRDKVLSNRRLFNQMLPTVPQLHQLSEQERSGLTGDRAPSVSPQTRMLHQSSAMSNQLSEQGRSRLSGDRAPSVSPQTRMLHQSSAMSNQKWFGFLMALGMLVIIFLVVAMNR
jgi:hypothetical protein